MLLPVDVEDVGDAYNFIADVPGLAKGDIKVCAPLSVFGVRNLHLNGAVSGTAVLRQRSPSRLQFRSCTVCIPKGYTYLYFGTLSGSALPTALHSTCKTWDAMLCRSRSIRRNAS